MNDAFLWFWSAMIFASIAWYAYLLFHVGIKGGWDIVRMTRALSARGNESRSNTDNDIPV